MDRRNTLSFIAIFLVASTVAAKEFVLNCALDGGAQLVFSFNEEKGKVNNGGVENNAIFNEHAIIFSVADWVHQVSRVTGQMIASKDGNNVTLKCSVVENIMF